MGLTKIHTTPFTYRRYIFRYGILSVLYVLEKYEEEEEYEECQKIVDAIINLQDQIGFATHTRISPDVIKEVRDYNKNLEEEDIIETSKYYSEIIIEEIDEKWKIKNTL